jgi:hypothetical protein
MMGNITINRRGQIIIQEDLGNQAYLAKIWLYDIGKDKLTEIALHDPDRFVSGASKFLPQDGESSGIIDVLSFWERAGICWCGRLTMLSMLNRW